MAGVGIIKGLERLDLRDVEHSSQKINQMQSMKKLALFFVRTTLMTLRVVS